MVHDLRRKYNRKYYRQLFKIWCKKNWKLLKINLISITFKIGYRIDKQVFVEMIRGINYRNKPFPVDFFLDDDDYEIMRMEDHD